MSGGRLLSCLSAATHHHQCARACARGAPPSSLRLRAYTPAAAALTASQGFPYYTTNVHHLIGVKGSVSNTAPHTKVRSRWQIGCAGPLLGPSKGDVRKEREKRRSTGRRRGRCGRRLQVVVWVDGEMALLPHQGGKVGRFGRGLKMEVAEVFVGTPTAMELDVDGVDVGAKERGGTPGTE